MTAPVRLFRIQDATGRGPWRPGFSHVWVSEKTPMGGKPISSEKGFSAAVSKGSRLGLHLGCAVRSDKVGEWFGPHDLERLKALGFSAVDASACEVLLETEQQVLIGSRLPLKFLPFANRPICEAV